MLLAHVLSVQLIALLVILLLHAQVALMGIMSMVVKYALFAQLSVLNAVMPITALVAILDSS